MKNKPGYAMSAFEQTVMQQQVEDLQELVKVLSVVAEITSNYLPQCWGMPPSARKKIKEAIDAISTYNELYKVK